MVRCSNAKCDFGLWFHSQCIDMAEGDLPKAGEDWWCCAACKNTGASVMCLCKRVRDGPVVKCSQGENCSHGVYFDLECVALHHVPGIVKSNLTLVLDKYECCI
jgi:hypothetical protein